MTSYSANFGPARLQSLSRAKKGLRLGLIAALIPLAACDYGNKEGLGTLAGAALGAWAGSAVDDSGSGGVVAVAAGTIIGGLIGNQIGRGLDKVDRMEAERTYQTTLETSPSGQANSWYNPDTGNSGSVVARPAYQASSGEYCREFTQTVNIGGRAEQAYGTACRQPDGTWKILG